MEALYQSRIRRDLPTWRSMLYIPGSNEKLLARAPTVPADAVVIDLEDSVAPQLKEAARARLPQSVAHAASGGLDVLVRVNRPVSMMVRDIEAAVCPHVRAIIVPKADGPSHVRLLDELVTECEERQGMKIGHTGLHMLIESTGAYHQMVEIASASPRVISMSLGNEDLALECGFEPSEDTLLIPKQQLVFACIAAGVRPMGFLSSIALFKDIEAFRTMVRRSRRFGYTGAACIHPAQAAVLNEEFAPSAEEIARAERIVREGDAATAEGRGAFLLDGNMIDIPIIEKARTMLAAERRRKAQASRAASGG